MAIRTARNLVVMAASAALLLGVAGCNSERPVEDIRVSADHRLSLGDYESAAAEYALIAERYPGDWQAQYKLGLCSLELEQYAEARQALEVAHTLRPRDRAVADALAEAMYRQGDENQLITFLREQAEKTRSVYAYRRLARYAVAQGDMDTANIALETAIEFDEGRSVEPYLDASDFAQRIGDLELAIRRLRQAYGIDPQDERVSERLTALGEIPGPTLALPPGR
ncbi:MAG: tetratricopeptide repeat protein [Planctomycetota bacterium]